MPRHRKRKRFVSVSGPHGDGRHRTSICGQACRSNKEAAARCAPAEGRQVMPPQIFRKTAQVRGAEISPGAAVRFWKNGAAVRPNASGVKIRRTLGTQAEAPLDCVGNALAGVSVAVGIYGVRHCVVCGGIV